MPGRITIVEQLGHGCTYHSSCAISGTTIITPPGIDSFQLNDNNVMDYVFPSSAIRSLALYPNAEGHCGAR